LFSELNSNDPIQRTHLISRHEVEIQLTNRKNILTETTPTNDVNQVYRIFVFLLHWSRIKNWNILFRRETFYRRIIELKNNHFAEENIRELKIRWKFFFLRFFRNQLLIIIGNHVIIRVIW
jgi:hypothetical protein